MALIAAKLPRLSCGLALDEPSKSLLGFTKALFSLKVHEPISNPDSVTSRRSRLAPHPKSFQRCLPPRELARERIGGRVAAGGLLWQGALCVAVKKAIRLWKCFVDEAIRRCNCAYTKRTNIATTAADTQRLPPRAPRRGSGKSQLTSEGMI